MPRTEISYRPSRAKQTLFVAILLVVFILSTAGFLLLWPWQPERIEDLATRMILYNLRGLGLILSAFFAVFSAVCVPILLVMLIRNRPAYTLTPDGIRVGALLIGWNEIDEIHEHVQTGGGMPRQVLIGIYPHDAPAIRARMSASARWVMDEGKKQNLPPIVLTTHHLEQSTEELLDEMEAYLDSLRADSRRRLPEVFRRQD